MLVTACTISLTKPLIVGGGVYLTVQGGTGSSTPSGILYGDAGATGSLKTVGIGSGLSFTGGTLAVSGVTAGSDSDWTAHNSYPVACSAGQFASAIGDTLTCGVPVASETYTGTVSTSSQPTLGNLAYWTGAGWPSTLGTVATTTLTATSPLALSQTISVIGSSASVLSITANTFDPYGQATNTLATHTTTYNHANYDTAYGWGNHANLYDIKGQATSTKDWLLAATNTWTGGNTFGNATTSYLGIGGDSLNELCGTGLTCTGNTLALDTAAAMTGTFDGNNFAGGAIGAGELLYGAGAGSIGEVGAGTAGRLLISGGTGIPSWVATSTVTISSPLSATAAIYSTGPASTLSCTTASASAAGCLSIASFNTFTNKISTSSVPTVGALAYWTGAYPATLNGVATSSITVSYPLSASAALKNVGAASTLSLSTGYFVSTTSSNTWASTQTFASIAGTINAGGAAYFELPNSATALTGVVTGQIAIDTTTGQLRYYNGTATSTLIQEHFLVFGYATSTAWSGTTTVYLAPAPFAITFKWVRCETDAGWITTSLYDGTNRADYMMASTTLNKNTYTTNNTFTAGESMRVDFATTTTSSTKQVRCRAAYWIDSD